MAAVFPTSGTSFDPTTAQPLPPKPGAMAPQPLRPKGSVTAGRPLPPRPGEAAIPAVASSAVTARAETAQVATATQGAMTPVVPQPAAITPPSTARHSEGGRPAKPDARPMRFAIGAGTLAAVSALTIGMVKPDFGGDETANLTGAAAANGEQRAIDAQRERERGRVRHVTEYVFLKPGETAPRGATVISASELGITSTRTDRPADRVSTTTRPDRQTVSDRDSTPQRDRQAVTRPEREPAPRPERQPAPQPDPPRVETRQSGG